MDKFDCYEQWQGAARDAIAALERFKATLGAWYCHGEEEHQGQFDAALRDLREAGLERWVADNEAGGGVDVLAVVAQGGDVCPSCQGHGTRVDGFDPESFTFPTCETCGGVGAIPASALACICNEPRSPMALAGEHAARYPAARTEPGGDPAGDFWRECVPAWERAGYEGT